MSSGGYSDPPPGLAVMTPPISVRDLEAEFSEPKTRAGYCRGRGLEDSLTSEQLYAFCSEEAVELECRWTGVKRLITRIPLLVMMLMLMMPKLPMLTRVTLVLLKLRVRL